MYQNFFIVICFFLILQFLQVCYVVSIILIDKKGLVAQWTRARGYEPRCRGFESLLARIVTLLFINLRRLLLLLSNFIS